MWIARDYNGAITLFYSNEIPVLNARTKCWETDNSYMLLDDEDYLEITFDNSPVLVELKFSIDHVDSKR